jgi:hypothetical protein
MDYGLLKSGAVLLVCSYDVLERTQQNGGLCI